MRTLLLTLVTSAALCGFAFGQAQLRPGDTVEIRLGNAPLEDIQQFAASYQIDENGTINLPYINNVRIAGLPIGRAQATIEEKLRAEEIYTNPSITINIHSQARFVNVGGGGVRSPGRIAYTPDLTLLSAINAVGGLNEYGSPKGVRLIRGGKASVYDLRDLNKDPEKDPKILPGDQIQVRTSMF